MFRLISRALLIVSLATTAAACSKAEGTTPAKKRNYTQDMRRETLAELYKAQPEARGKISKAAGYAVFSNFGMNIFVLASGNGFGVAHDNASGRDVYMTMNEIGLGIGLGAKEFRAIIILQSKEAVTAFMDSGWEWGGDADAVAKTGDDMGESASASMSPVQDMEVYLMTETGIALQATLSGTKYFADDELNGKAAAKD